MNREPQRTTGGLWAALPHPGVLAVSLLLAIAGAWYGMPGSADEPSAAVSSVLRQQAERAKTQYLRASRQAATTRTRLMAAQGRLEHYAHEQFDELRRAADIPVASEPAEPLPIESPDLTDAVADRLEVQRLQGQLAELSEERSNLLVRLTPEHPSVVDLDSRIANVHRLIDILPKSVEPARLPVDLVDQSVRQAQERLQRHWSGLVDAAIAGSQPIEHDCHQIQQELSVLEQKRAMAEKDYLARSDAVAAATVAAALEAPRSKDLATGLLGCAIGLPLLALAGRAMAQLGLGGAKVIRSAGDFERLFHLPVVGSISSGGGAVGTTIARSVPLLLQVVAAFVVFLLVSMTIQDPTWITQIGSHPIDVVRHAVGMLGAS